MTEIRKESGRTTEAPERRPGSMLMRPFEEMERLYESIFPHGWLRPFQWEMPSWEKARPFFAHRMPVLDMIDRDNELLIRAEVPGVRKEDLSISLDDSTLTLRGRTEREEETRREDYYCHEMSYGEFSRTVTLPVEVDSTKAKARMTDGVLEITLPKRESARRRSVSVAID